MTVTYILQVSLGIIVAWALYHLVLKGRTAARTNRAFLLGGLVLPFLLPLIPLGAGTLETARPILLPAISITGTAQALESQASNTPWLFYIYLGGVIAILLYHFNSILVFLRLTRKAEKLTGYQNVYILPNGGMPFSFFGRIFLPENLSAAQREVIIAHEQGHIKCLHSADVLLGMLAQTAVWFLPVLPFYLRDLKREHEYEVDQLVLNQTPFSEYAETLLHVSLMPIHNTQFHSFSSKKLKQRIIMMTKAQKPNTWKLLILIPLAGSMLYLNACNKQSESFPEAPSTLKMGEVDSPPQFENCQEGAERTVAQQCFNQGLMQHLITNMKYPEDAFEAGVEGKVFVSITIDENGNLKSPEVVKSDVAAEHAAYQEVLEAAALKVFTNFPGLRPAQKDGKPVGIEYVVPISFKLPPKESQPNTEQAALYGPQQESYAVTGGDGC